jgi:hypothetical protein
VDHGLGVRVPVVAHDDDFELHPAVVVADEEDGSADLSLDGGRGLSART